MPIVSGGGGSGLPLSGGTIAGTLEIDGTSNATELIVKQFAGQNAEIVGFRESGGGDLFSVFVPGGGQLVGIGGGAGQAGDVALVVNANPAQTADIAQVRNSTGVAIYGGYNKNGYWFTTKTAAPADAELSANQLMLWFDPTNGASKLMVKAKQADGTVRTASIALA